MVINLDSNMKFLQALRRNKKHQEFPNNEPLSMVPWSQANLKIIQLVLNGTETFVNCQIRAEPLPL